MTTTIDRSTAPLPSARAHGKATADDLAHVARKYLIPENRVTSLFVPEA